MAVLPVLVIVTSLVRPVFHALTAFTTRQMPVPPELLFEGEGDGDPGVLDGDGETGGVLGDELWGSVFRKPRPRGAVTKV